MTSLQHPTAVAAARFEGVAGDASALEVGWKRARAAVGVAAVAVGFAAVMSGVAAAQEAAGSEHGVVLTEFLFDDAPHAECHASTIVETPSGALLAAWFGGTEEGDDDVEIWLSRLDAGRDGAKPRWSAPVAVADGVQAGGERHPTWNPVLHQPPQEGAPLLLFFKVGPSPREWWGMAMESNDEGRAWSAPRRLPDGILGPIRNKPVTLVDGSLLAGSSVEDAPAPVTWRAHFERSKDFGRSWTRTEALAGTAPGGEPFSVIQPTILTLDDGELLALFRSRESVVAASRSTDGGRTWGPVRATGLPNSNAAVDGVTLADGRQLLVYNHKVRIDGAWAGSRSRLNVALSDDGDSWDASLMLEDDAEGGEYSYPAVIQARDGLVHVTWTHRRTRIRHAVLDPRSLPRRPMAAGEWPASAPVLAAAVRQAE